MEQETNAMGMLDLMVRPGFCVKNNIIVKVNSAAQSCMICEGTDVRTLFVSGTKEYEQFTNGCLYLSMSLCGQEWGASVTCIEDYHVFILEQDADRAELQAMALAARELREPLTSVMTTADRLFPMAAKDDDPVVREQVARLNRGLFQMLRVISNMSDANRYSNCASVRQETVDLCALLRDVFSRAEELVAHTGLTLSYAGIQEPIFCLADSEKLERAVLNIISNAIKFTPKGGSIEAKLTRRGNMLYLQIRDNGQGIAEQLKGSIHSRYLRQPAIEDSRFGLGLGMVLIRSAAAQHGGTVLVDQPENGGTRITLSLAIRQNPSGTLRSHVLRVDYAGERDHCLIELSDCLPASLYESSKIN